MKNWEKNIRKVVPYTPGEQPKKSQIIKLNTNENPYPPAPGVKEAEKPQGIVLRILNELMKVQEPGYKLYDKIVEGFEKIDDVIATAVKDQQNAAWLFAEKYSANADF